MYQKATFHVVWWPLYRCFLVSVIPLKVNYVFNTFLYVNDCSRLKCYFKDQQNCLSS